MFNFKQFVLATFFAAFLLTGLSCTSTSSTQADSESDFGISDSNGPDSSPADDEQAFESGDEEGEI